MPEVTSPDRNCLSWWFPKIAQDGLPVPLTEVVRTDAEIGLWLDGENCEGGAEFLNELQGAVESVGTPCFLRTGQTSGKHLWADCCYLPDVDVLAQHVCAIVEYSIIAGFPRGLDYNVWVARRLIDTDPLFVCDAYGGFPVAREFRLFVRDEVVEHAQPYWPEQAVADGRPDDPEWRSKLAEAAKWDREEANLLKRLAVQACEAVGMGYWSVDFLQDNSGQWWLTDMAEGDRSFKYDPPELEEPT